MKKQFQIIVAFEIITILGMSASFGSAPIDRQERKDSVSKPVLVGAIAVFDDGKKSVPCSVPDLNNIKGNNRVTKAKPETLGYQSCNSGQMAMLNQLNGSVKSVDASLSKEAFLGSAASKAAGFVWKGVRSTVPGLICTDAGLRMRSVAEANQAGKKIESEVVVVGVVAPATVGLMWEGANQYRMVNEARNPSLPLPREIGGVAVRAQQPVLAAAAGRGLSICGLLFAIGFSSPELEKASKASVEQTSKAVTWFKLFTNGPTQGGQ